MPLFGDLAAQLDTAGERLAAVRRGRRRRAQLVALTAAGVCALGGIATAAAVLWHDDRSGAGTPAGSQVRRAAELGHHR